MHGKANPYWFWRIVALLAGLLIVWFGRHSVNPDGISYIEVADAYLRADWRGAINGYWSPLYSWMIALVKAVVKPNAYWEFATVHIVNLGFYVISLACFERLLRTFLRWLEYRLNAVPLPPTTQGLYRTTGYALFLSVGISGVPLVNTTPDVLVTAIVYLASSLLLEIRMDPCRERLHLTLGMVLGLGYLTKAAMFPVAILFLTASVPWSKIPSGAGVRRFAASLTVFVLTCAPFLIALSWQKGRLTFGDSGRINYAWEISGVRRISHWQGGPGYAGNPIHPTTQIRTQPELFGFDAPPGAMYAVWSDPSYWHEGVRFHMDLRRQIANLSLNMVAALVTFLTVPGAVAILGLLKFQNRASLARLWDMRFLILPCLGAVALYCIVLMSRRYVSMFLAVVVLACLGAVELGRLSPSWRRFLQANVAIATLGAIAWPLCIALYADGYDLLHHRELVPNRQWLLAREAIRMGLKRDDKVGFIGVTTTAYWLHVAGARTVVEVPMIADLDRGLTSTIHENMREIETFWRAEKAVRDQILASMRARGARFVYADKVPPWAPTEGWQKFNTLLPDKSGYHATYVYVFP